MMMRDVCRYQILEETYQSKSPVLGNMFDFVMKGKKSFIKGWWHC